MATRKEKLEKRFIALTKNNVAIIEAYPDAVSNWNKKIRELKALSLDKLEIQIIFIEGKYTEMKKRESDKRKLDDDTLVAALVKLEALGLTRKELLLIIKG